MVVFLGESGDTDYGGLFGRLHKTVILSGTCKSNQSSLLARRTYSLEHVAAFESPSIVQTSEGYNRNDL